jgi:putative CocE/NonD family hydrolase
LLNAADDVLSGDKLQSYRETISNPLDNDFWKKIHFTDEELSELDIPMFFTDGWYDMTVGPIDFFSRLDSIHQGQGPDRYLLVGPWDHSQTYAVHEAGSDHAGRVLKSNGAVDLVAQRLAFFDRYLKGNKEAVVQEDRVRVYITGADNSNANVWRNFSTFPVPGNEQKHLYLHSQGGAHNIPSDGMLGDEPPIEEPADHYVYDPSLPTASAAESSQDRRQIEIRTDVLTYTTAPLSESMTILGDITLVLHAASDAPDTDWFAIITEVFPDGQSRSFHCAPPAFRARYREGFDHEAFLAPNKPEEFRIPMGPVGHQIAAGHCVRVSIFRSAFPEYDPHRNTGNLSATDTEMRIAKQTVFHDSIKPSHLVLPIIDF